MADENVSQFLFDMSPDVPALKVRIFTNDFFAPVLGKL